MLVDRFLADLQLAGNIIYGGFLVTEVFEVTFETLSNFFSSARFQDKFSPVYSHGVLAEAQRYSNLLRSARATVIAA